MTYSGRPRLDWQPKQGMTHSGVHLRWGSVGTETIGGVVMAHGLMMGVSRRPTTL
jgi:hypothetical protein